MRGGGGALFSGRRARLECLPLPCGPLMRPREMFFIRNSTVKIAIVMRSSRLSSFVDGALCRREVGKRVSRCQQTSNCRGPNEN